MSALMVVTGVFVRWSFWTRGSNLQLSRKIRMAASALMPLDEFHRSLHHLSDLRVDSLSRWMQRHKSSMLAGRLQVPSKFLMKSASRSLVNASSG